MIFDPTAANRTPYNVFASIDAAPDESERQERLGSSLPICCCHDDSQATVKQVYFLRKMVDKMTTAALICYYGMGWGFVEICEHFPGHDWRGLLNDIAQRNKENCQHVYQFLCRSK